MIDFIKQLTDLQINQLKQEYRAILMHPDDYRRFKQQSKAKRLTRRLKARIKKLKP